MIFEFSKSDKHMWITCLFPIECHLLDQNRFTNVPVICDQKSTWNSWFLPPPPIPLLRIFEISFFFTNVDHVEAKRMQFEFWKLTGKKRRSQGGGGPKQPPPPHATNRGSQEPATNRVKPTEVGRATVSAAACWATPPNRPVATRSPTGGHTMADHGSRRQHRWNRSLLLTLDWRHAQQHWPITAYLQRTTDVRDSTTYCRNELYFVKTHTLVWLSWLPTLRRPAAGRPGPGYIETG